jgi:Glycosyltransferase family 10 (fucosyltransferase) C-term
VEAARWRVLRFVSLASVDNHSTLSFKNLSSHQVDNELLKLAKGKQKTAAWFASHCGVFSKRDELVEKLQEFIDVDVYGKCGSLKCPRLSSECDELLNSTYRFYLAFENTLCIDYLTEKLFNTINHNVVPVIFSGAELSRFLPPKSYIDANDFATVEELASFLQSLAEHPEEYIKYFWWRKHYQIMRWDHMELCALCQKLNEPNPSSKRQVYVSIKDWFYKNACTKSRINFWIPARQLSDCCLNKQFMGLKSILNVESVKSGSVEHPMQFCIIYETVIGWRKSALKANHANNCTTHVAVATMNESEVFTSLLVNENLSGWVDEL